MNVGRRTEPFVRSLAGFGGNSVGVYMVGAAGITRDAAEAVPKFFTTEGTGVHRVERLRLALHGCRE
jgi:hypothetical protein